MLPVEGAPIPSGPRYLTYDPTPPPLPELPTLTEEVTEGVREFARQAVLTLYVVGVVWWVLYVIGRYRGVL
ncbi:MAG: hypothetical protein JWO67_2043 [Streptosporangiaceae bacterium]|nr:hypothetical protein [Streptosporangiaceae bacterium]